MFICNGKKITSVGFLGYGKSNKGIRDYLGRHFDGLRFVLRSDSPVSECGDFFQSIHSGRSVYEKFDEDILFLSPSARRDKTELVFAENRGMILSSDAEFFLSNTQSDVFAVTGSDGKSTTAALTSMMIADSYSDAIPCGNIGEAMTPHLDDIGNPAYVAELSSFQLMYMKPKVRRALITNITKNHLNWHASFDEYISAKRNVFENARERIINFDCEISRSFAKDYPIFAVFSRRTEESELKRTIKSEIYVTEKDGFITVSGESVLALRDIRIVGEHNVLNFMAAIAMSYGLARKELILQTAKNFAGLRHRCELIRELRGVRYYDSSIDSSPKRTCATLHSFSEKVIVILGGRSKGLDFSELIPALKRKAKAIVLMGECAEEIAAELSRDSAFESDIPYVKKYGLRDAAEYAITIAACGDSVVLSPAATSYDEFKNFEERGDAFRKIINGL